ncbi:phosphodiesterase [Pararhizobium sp. IMCC21322]|uniref:phosphodiesterase n=1 Tax=Pararhizobium sp. IMCC21322 TaxID=3067903 RepID=UPI002740BA71|nr:phosphodiesterase [Pararhizobium sp. IMCC21322]
MTRIIQLSDIHMVEQRMLAYNVVDTAEYLAHAVSYIVDLLPKIGPVDGIVITGDLTDHGRQAQYDRLKELLSPLRLPLCVLPGNHDDRDVMRAAFSEQPWQPKNGGLNSHIQLGNVHVLALDCLVSGKAHGFLTAETLAWLENELALLTDEPVIFALHHPPFETGIGHMDAQPLHNAETLLKLVSGHMGPKITICGHIHRYMTSHQPCGPIMIGPSVAHAVCPDLTEGGASQFSLEPGGFLLHSYDSATRVFLSHYLPVGPHSGPFPFKP